jgi:hypothetical protein
MPCAEQPQFFPDGRSGVADPVYGTKQLLLRYSERLGPVFHFPRFARVDLAAVRRALLDQAYHRLLHGEHGPAWVLGGRKKRDRARPAVTPASTNKYVTTFLVPIAKLLDELGTQYAIKMSRC